MVSGPINQVHKMPQTRETNGGWANNQKITWLAHLAPIFVVADVMQPSFPIIAPFPPFRAVAFLAQLGFCWCVIGMRVCGCYSCKIMPWDCNGLWGRGTCQTLQDLPTLLRMRSAGLMGELEVGACLGRGSFGRVYKGSPLFFQAGMCQADFPLEPRLCHAQWLE
jgi:hypothetical protein